MTYEKISIYRNKDVERTKEIFKKYSPSEKEFRKVLEYLRLLSLGEIASKSVGDVRQKKILDMLIIFYKNLKKDPEKIILDDMRDFKEKLMKDKIKKENKKPYSEATKEDISGVIVKYFEWRIPNNFSKWNLRKWFIVKFKKKTPEYLSEDEVQKLFECCKTDEERFIISGLFDMGARIEEFLNIRFQDVISPTESFPYYKIDLKEEYSKTKGRIIGLYWKNSSKAIREYLLSIPKGNPSDRILDKNYDAIRIFLTRFGKKILNKRIHAHLLRKSSTTYYADKLNRQEICYRYGWNFSSNVPDLYIARAGMKEEGIKDKILNTDLSKINKRNEELETIQAIIKNDLEKTKEQNKYFAYWIKAMTDAMSGAISQKEAILRLKAIAKNTGVKLDE